ncbi:hypothetical protein [Actinoallomurus sp. NPDC052274]|uniref:hypothetical protein n=1 Tax=Actinoallomurus sp. NPDC052274 TaxID=3155420 RepID=UPI00341F2D68
MPAQPGTLAMSVQLRVGDVGTVELGSIDVPFTTTSEPGDDGLIIRFAVDQPALKTALAGFLRAAADNLDEMPPEQADHA